MSPISQDLKIRNLYHIFLYIHVYINVVQFELGISYK